MNLNLGTQLVAPRGFEGLKADVVYHLLFNDAVRNRALFVTFGAPAPGLGARSAPAAQRLPRAELAYLRRDRFEEALRSALIRPVPEPRELPHWFGDLTITDLLMHDRQDHRRQKPHAHRIDVMLAHLWPAVQRSADILSAEAPQTALNRIARSCVPPQNEARFRQAFFVYLAFGRERLALHYPIANLGKWDRAAKDKKFGRPSLLGAWHGHSSCPEAIQAMCLEGFRTYAAPGQSLRAIHRKTAVRVFGCVPTRDSRQRMSLVHPEGKPFPTYGQFAYRVGLAYDLRTRQLLKFGSARVRSKIAISQGKYTDATANAMETLQEDGYFVDEVAAGYLEGSHLPKISVVRIICVGSAVIVGIGFSFKGEKAEAYRMAKFCMAVDKVWFCSLFGIAITEDQWPSAGLPLHEVVDRGPGATRGADATDPALQPVIKEIAPSYSGQSKANVETRHPKSVKQEGAPQYRITRQSVVQLVQREIYRVIESNESTNVLPRLGPEAIRRQVLSTPNGLWRHLVGLGRTFAYQPPRDQAIRGYLVPVDLTVSDGAVYFMGFRFWSKALRDSKLLERCVTQVQGYLLPMCVRHIFIDTPDGMLTVDASFGIRSAEGESFLSVAELEQLAELRSREQAAFRIHREAAKAEVAERFKAETGHEYDRSELRAGRAKRGNAASVEEARQIAPLLRANGKIR
ncbi:MAG TPA: hypothetical protein VGM81_07640 [Burkholderiaceae bacterium]|jgi:hypothetical protein